MNYPPTVTINGEKLECEFTPSGNAVILDGIEIDWGRDSLYEPTGPGELTLTLLDPVGSYASDPALFGAEITVSTSIEMLFRGQIDSITITPDQIGSGAQTAGSSPNIDVWRVELRATDLIATLAKLTAPGYEASGLSPAYRTVYGPGYWAQNNAEGRRVELQNRVRSLGYSRVIISTRDYAQSVPPGKTWSMYYRVPTRKAGDTLYELISDIQSRGDEIFHSSYVPSTERLTIGRMPKAAGLVLTYAGGIIGLAGESAGGAALVVDCRKVTVDGDGSLTADVTHNIAAVDIDQFNATTQLVPLGTIPETYASITDYTEVTWSAAISNPSGGSARYAPPSMVVSQYYGDQGWSEGAPEIVATIGPILSALNGRLMPPEMIFDLELETYDAEVYPYLLKTWTSRTSGDIPKAWSFPGSKYENLTGWGPFFQQIGGHLSFRQGWEIAVRFAPSLLTAGSLTISQLVTTDPPTFDQYADIISLTTLGSVVRGV